MIREMSDYRAIKVEITKIISDMWKEVNLDT